MSTSIVCACQRQKGVRDAPVVIQRSGKVEHHLGDWEKAGRATSAQVATPAQEKPADPKLKQLKLCLRRCCCAPSPWALGALPGCCGPLAWVLWDLRVSQHQRQEHVVSSLQPEFKLDKHHSRAWTKF